MMLRFASFPVMRLCHRICCSSLTKQWHAEHGVRLFQGWPGNSLDLNPIENLWSQMKVMQSHKCTTSVAGLKRIALRVWKMIHAVVPESLVRVNATSHASNTGCQRRTHETLIEFCYYYYHLCIVN